MSQFTWHKVANPGGIKALIEEHVPQYLPDRMPEWADQLSTEIRSIMLERPCTDEDFDRSYFSSELLSDSEHLECVRIHFFAAGVTYNIDSGQFSRPEEEVAARYRGFVTLRPLTELAVGSTVIDPRTVGAHGHLNVAPHRLSVNGLSLQVTGFAWMNQLPMVATCAYIGSWSIFRHCYAMGWSDRILSLREINDTVLRMSPDSAPSNDGMNLQAAAKLLETVIPSCRLTWIQDDDEATFLDTLVAYVDSGFPILAEVREREHAVAVVGYRLDSERVMPSSTEGVTLRGVITGLYVSDDHHFPYHYVPCIVSETEKNDTRRYQVQHIRGFATVFPWKDFIDFDRAKTVLSKLVAQYGPSLWTPPRNESVTRIFARSWEVMKRHVCSSVNRLQVEEQEKLNDISWPPHVWVAEISNPKNALGGVAATFISAAGTDDVSFSLCFSSHSVIVNSAGVNFILGRNGLGKPHRTVLSAVTTLTAYS